MNKLSGKGFSIFFSNDRFLSSPKPSSCVQCHLASVDLKNFILPTQEKTFASLRDQGLINLEKPAESKILKLIRMGERDLDKGASLIHARTRAAELEAFAERFSQLDRPKQAELVYDLIERSATAVGEVVLNLYRLTIAHDPGPITEVA